MTDAVEKTARINDAGRPLTPSEAYYAARKEVQEQHRYTTEGNAALCACGKVSTILAVGEHIEEAAEKAGAMAREHAVALAVARHEGGAQS